MENCTGAANVAIRGCNALIGACAKVRKCLHGWWSSLWERGCPVDSTETCLVPDNLQGLSPCVAPSTGDQVERRGLDITVASFSRSMVYSNGLWAPAFAAFTQAAQWEAAVSVLREMPSRGLEPNFITYTATIDGFARAMLSATRQHRVQYVTQQAQQAHM